jgi:uncharacterized membrane protein SpoIIM required for sporulation
LAQARRALPGESVVGRLESLVGRARTLVYDTEARRESIVEFFTTGYWRRLRSDPRTLLIAAALLLVPAALAFVWAARDPAAAVGVVPEAFRGIGDGSRSSRSAGLSGGESSAFASQIMTNNIRVTFLAFASGITFGVGTVFVLVFNGVLLGAVGGLSLHAGRGDTFVTLVVAHGILELSCIVVAGAAGLRIGQALVRPGRRTRGAALMTEAREAVELVIGTAPWLVVAGLIEGFITPAGYGLGVNLAVGLVVGGTYWLLVVVRGRPATAEPSLLA